MTFFMSGHVRWNKNICYHALTSTTTVDDFANKCDGHWHCSSKIRISTITAEHQQSPSTIFANEYEICAVFLSSNVRLCPFEKSPASNTGKRWLPTIINQHIKIDGQDITFLKFCITDNMRLAWPAHGTPIRRTQIKRRAEEGRRRAAFCYEREHSKAGFQVGKPCPYLLRNLKLKPIPWPARSSWRADYSASVQTHH